MKAEKEQFNIRPDKRTIDRLQKLADTFNRRSKSAVAVEIIEQYMDFWEQAELAKFNVLTKQRGMLSAPTPVNRSEKPDAAKKKTGS